MTLGGVSYDVFEIVPLDDCKVGVKSGKLNAQEFAKQCAVGLTKLASGGKQYEAKMAESRKVLPNVWTVVEKK